MKLNIPFKMVTVAIGVMSAVCANVVNAQTLAQIQENSYSSINNQAQKVANMLDATIYWGDARFLWHDPNGNVSPKNEKELIKQLITYYRSLLLTANQSLKYEFIDTMLSKDGWYQFVDCMVGNPRNKKEISLYYAGVGRNIDQQAFYFLYPKRNPKGWGIDFKKADSLRSDFLAIAKQYPEMSPFLKSNELFQYHPYVFASKAYSPRTQACVNRFADVYKQSFEAEIYDNDPLNKAKGRTFQYRFSETPQIAWKMMSGYLNTKDYVKEIYDYSYKKALKVDLNKFKSK